MPELKLLTEPAHRGGCRCPCVEAAHVVVLSAVPSPCPKDGSWEPCSWHHQQVSAAASTGWPRGWSPLLPGERARTAPVAKPHAPSSADGQPKELGREDEVLPSSRPAPSKVILRQPQPSLPKPGGSSSSSSSGTLPSSVLPPPKDTVTIFSALIFAALITDA